MSKRAVGALAVAIGVAFSAGAMAQAVSKGQYKSAKDGIAAEYKAAKAACGSLSGNAKDICMAEAGGKEKVAKAELEASYKPSADARYKLRLAGAAADYSVARERCDDKAGNVKDVCVKEAKAAELAAKADAKVQKQSVGARKDAAAVKRDADYAVAKEKCDTFAGEAKSACMNEAKARFGKS